MRNTTSDVITLRNRAGASAEVIARGATIRALSMPDRNGTIEDVVLGYDAPADYQQDLWYMGAVIGRYANRIRHGRFSIGDVAYQLPVNSGPHHLHGGPSGFHAVDWQPEIIAENTVRLHHVSPDGDQGYPGNLAVEVTYVLTDENSLDVTYRATTDAPTVINLTQHTYFNLGGESALDVLDHEVTIAADAFLPVDEQGIPLGTAQRVAGTPFDFREPRSLRRGPDRGDEQLRVGNGYDHCFVLRERDAEPTLAAEVYDRRSGRILTVLTTEPGMQLYMGQYLAGARGKRGRLNNQYAGLCLETQHFPDSPNQPRFPSALIEPGTAYGSKTTFLFGTRPESHE